VSEVYSNTRFKKDGGFCVRKKVIKRDIYQIIIPMILENILQISANLVITAMVGRLLANDISAQGICIRITDTLWCFYKGVAIGATVLIARAYGAGRHQDCRKIAEQTILTEMIIVFVFQVVLYFKAPLFLGFFFLACSAHGICILVLQAAQYGKLLSPPLGWGMPAV